MKFAFVILMPVLLLAACSKDTKRTEQNQACEPQVVEAYNNVFLASGDGQHQEAQYQGRTRDQLKRNVDTVTACANFRNTIGQASCPSQRLQSGSTFMISATEPAVLQVCDQSELYVKSRSNNNRPGRRGTVHPNDPTPPMPKPVNPGPPVVDSRPLKRILPIELTVTDEDTASDFFESGILQNGRIVRSYVNLKRDADFCTIGGYHIGQTLFFGEILFIVKVQQVENLVYLTLNEDRGQIVCQRPNSREMTAAQLKKVLNGPFKLSFR